MKARYELTVKGKIPAQFRPEYFPRQFCYKKDAEEVALAILKAGGFPVVTKAK
jgi:hypothetical protein